MEGKRVLNYYIAMFKVGPRASGGRQKRLWNIWISSVVASMPTPTISLFLCLPPASPSPSLSLPYDRNHPAKLLENTSQTRGSPSRLTSRTVLCWAAYSSGRMGTIDLAFSALAASPVPPPPPPPPSPPLAEAKEGDEAVAFLRRFPLLLLPEPSGADAAVLSRKGDAMVDTSCWGCSSGSPLRLLPEGRSQASAVEVVAVMVVAALALVFLFRVLCVLRSFSFFLFLCLFFLSFLSGSLRLLSLLLLLRARPSPSRRPSLTIGGGGGDGFIFSASPRPSENTQRNARIGFGNLLF